MTPDNWLLILTPAVLAEMAEDPDLIDPVAVAIENAIEAADNRDEQAAKAAN